MDPINCDFSPVKQEITQKTLQLIQELQHNLDLLGSENYCVLSGLEAIREDVMQIEAMAASFYLNCYLSAYTNTYKDLSICVQHLSENRHGALIVVERHDPLDNLIQKGTKIGAIVTSTLLESIFYPGNPLHDGAVLIRANEIVSAANILPLTRKNVRKKELGTRHRAAIGITEKSDALALVVSEETRKISFALNGILHPINTTRQ